MRIQPGMVAGWLTKGVPALEPIDVPVDLEIMSARMNFQGLPIIELLVRSDSFDGENGLTFELAKTWTATFRRKSPAAAGGKDARKGT
ncbi:MAG TPA: hypothetical protein VJY35_08880 [Candidatus Eisenbacteria bacterium]|nr:hypothetical protein [Candidatus Eisenbacteria bacterium]